eukprot:5967916-Amphidinium_carterae.4
MVQVIVQSCDKEWVAPRMVRGGSLTKSCDTGVLASQRNMPRRCRIRIALGVASSSESESTNVEPMLGHEHEDEALETCAGPPA